MGNKHKNPNTPSGVLGFLAPMGDLNDLNATVLWTIARRVGPRRHHNSIKSLHLRQNWTSVLIH